MNTNMITCPKCDAPKRRIKKKRYSGGFLNQVTLLGAAMTPIIGWAWLIFFWKPQYRHTCKDCGAEWITA